MPSNAKPWHLSKTMWFNAILAGAVSAEAGLGALQPLLGDNAHAVLAYLLVIGNAMLRVVTKQPLGPADGSGGDDEHSSPDNWGQR